jgi:hypothetical protein
LVGSWSKVASNVAKTFTRRVSWTRLPASAPSAPPLPNRLVTSCSGALLLAASGLLLGLLLPPSLPRRIFRAVPYLPRRRRRLPPHSACFAFGTFGSTATGWFSTGSRLPYPSCSSAAGMTPLYGAPASPLIIKKTSISGSPTWCLSDPSFPSFSFSLRYELVPVRWTCSPTP